jgi:hypothetical protein
MIDDISDEEIIMVDELREDPVFCYVYSEKINNSLCWYGTKGTLIVINLFQLVDKTKQYIINDAVSSKFIQYLTVHELCHWATDEEEVEGEWLKALGNLVY